MLEELRDGRAAASVVTYGELAARAGNPRAARAVGTACARNPIPIVVPCHRVLPGARRARQLRRRAGAQARAARARGRAPSLLSLTLIDLITTGSTGLLVVASAWTRADLVDDVHALR